MVDIDVSRGLDLPIEGAPTGALRSVKSPSHVALDLDSFYQVRLQLLVNAGDSVQIDQPLAVDKDHPHRAFVSPGTGKIKEVIRGEKRRLLKIVVQLDAQEEPLRFAPIDLERLSREELATALAQRGLFAHLKMRPFNRLANPAVFPKAIFVKAVESAPFAPSAEMQVEGFEEFFQIGLNALAKLSQGPVHLVHRKGSSCAAFTEAQNVQKHTIVGPHPSGNVSVHIHHIDPIRSSKDLVWTATVQDVIAIGRHVKEGIYHVDRTIGVGGSSIHPNACGFFRTRQGAPLNIFLHNQMEEGEHRIISGDLLTGVTSGMDEHLGFFHQVISAIAEEKEREFLHFFGVGANKFTATKAYLSGMLKPWTRLFRFTTNQHGEERAFIDPVMYDQVMPMCIPTVFLVKAVMTKNYELAEELGLLEVDSEDFALSTFICPSKIEISHIMKEGIDAYSQIVLA
jgi:Na+-transporting NADH:ubiquinone oxidoreductase subunit A